jgi:hypothetical protein
MDALKDRVRFLIESQHWQTDGEWKESVVRQMLRRHLPASVTVGRGFVVSASQASHQIDVLIYDSSKPVLFRDGDLAFVTPDAVIGVIEVKSRATPTILRDAAVKLATDMGFVRRHPNSEAFAGFLAFEEDGGSTPAYLEAVSHSAETWDDRLDFASIGRCRFIRYWHLDPQDERHFYEGWHSYALPDTAPGFFIHNVIDAVSPQSVFSNKEVWFPHGNKEVFFDGSILGRWPSQRPRSAG